MSTRLPKTVSVTVRLDAATARRLDALASGLGLTRSEAVRACIRGARPVVVSATGTEELRRMMRTFSGIGTNVNQLAHVANRDGLTGPTASELAATLGDVARSNEAVAEGLASLRERMAAVAEEVASDERA
ncbi:MAG: plasmid mobilization protein [Olsenella sp.]